MERVAEPVKWTAEANRAYVRRLLEARDPEFALELKQLETLSLCEQCAPRCSGCLAGEGLVLTEDGKLLCHTHAQLRLDLAVS